MAEELVLYTRHKVGKRVRYKEYVPPVEEEAEDVAEIEDVGVLDLTAHNQSMLAYYRDVGGTGCYAGVTCPSPECDGRMFYRSNLLLGNQQEVPAKRQVSCRVCGRNGMKLI